MLDGIADDLKLVLSEPDLFKTLLLVMERCERSAVGDDQSTLMNLTADLIVLLLTGGHEVSVYFTKELAGKMAAVI